MRPDRINESIGDRLDRLRLPDVGPVASKAGDHNKAVMDRRRTIASPTAQLKRRTIRPLRLLTLVKGGFKA
jgi:hypothetical protein